MRGKSRLEEAMNLRHSFSVAQNATTHSENTAKHYDFGKISNIASELERLGYSEACLKTTFLILHFFLYTNQANVEST
jgi:hypothetical protein